MNSIFLKDYLQKTVTFFMYCYIATLPLMTFQVFEKVSLSFICAILFLLPKMLSWILFERKVAYETISLTLAGLVGYLMISELIVHRENISQTYFITLSSNAFMLIALVDEFKKRPHTRERGFLLFSCSACSIGIFMILNIATTISQDQRFTFMDINPNELALVLFIAYSHLTIYLLREPFRKAETIVLATLSILAIFWIVNTGTRFTLGFLIVYAIILLFVPHKKNRKIKIFAGFLSLIIITFLLASPNSMQKRILSDLSDISQADQETLADFYYHDIDNGLIFSPDGSLIEQNPSAFSDTSIFSLGGRVKKWIDSYHAFTESPIFGLGYSGYREFLVVEKKRRFGLPHNFIFEIAAIGGIIGLLILLAVIIKVFDAIRNYWIKTGSIDLLLYSLPIITAFSFLNIVHIKPVWFLIAFFVTYSITTTKHKGKQQHA